MDHIEEINQLFSVGLEWFWILLFPALLMFTVWFYCFKNRSRKVLLYNDSNARNKSDEKTNWQPPRLLQLYGVKELHAIEDNFKSLGDVSKALRLAGLESCNLIFGVDFTKSNEWQGEKTFNNQCLHQIRYGYFNPYQQVIIILGETLEKFDEDGFIPAFGFGDIFTKDEGVFPLQQTGICKGFEEVLQAYNYIAQHVRLSGPTNFAPLIKEAIEIVKRTRQYHILVIVADGQVTSERDTQQAIVDASYYPLSIVLIGVGDGPWDMMDEFDNSLPQRIFDNFQFVNYHQISGHANNRQAAFALHALMEIPDQFNEIRRLGLLNNIH